MNRQIDMKDRRLFEDFRLKNSSLERIREVGVVGTAYDSIFAHDMTYISTPITSGAILYKLLADTGAKNIDELPKDKGFFFENVIKPNIDNAEIVAKHILDLKGGAIIAPAAFEAKRFGWGQDEYMGLWFDVIEKKVTSIVLLDGWEYSNGAVEEYLQALLMQAGRRDRANIEIIDQRGNMITLPQACRSLGNAIDSLLGRDFKPITTAIVLNRVLRLYDIIDAEFCYGQGEPKAPKYKGVGPNYTGTFGEPGEMEEMRDDMALVFKSAHRLIPEEEHCKITFEMSPSSNYEEHGGLIRKSERKELADSGVKIHTKDEK